MSDDTHSNGRLTRRAALARGGALATGAVGLSGCVGGLGGGSSDSLTLGTLPVFPMMQYFVIDGKGWYEDELDTKIDVKQFGGGPPLVQAYASGELDLAYVGISPGAIAIANGVASKVVAANVVEPNVMVGNETFRSYWKDHGPGAFEEFRKQEGRKPSFATLPAGSTPDVFLRYWLTEHLGLSLDVVQIKGMGSSSLQSTLAAGKADAGSVIEPIPTILTEGKNPGMRPFQYAGDIMPGQPGAVLQPSQALVDDRPDLVRDLVRIHLRATSFIHDNREKAAEMASEFVGSDVLPPETAKKAIRSPASTFISDPHRIVDKTLVYNEYHRKLGKVDKKLTESDVFEHRFYDEVSSDGGGS